MTDHQFKKEISINIGNLTLEGELAIPENAPALVIFSHGSGSSRFSSRNNFVATELHKRRIGTFLFDLLTKEEDEYYENRFNIDLLTERLVHVTKFMATHKESRGLAIGYFGASTGAASSLRAAALLPDLIRAVVGRGGRPDLAMEILPKVNAPTLLIVGARDQDVLVLNKKAFEKLRCEKKIEVVPTATHLFEEPGTLGTVAALAGDWFLLYLQNISKKLPHNK